MLPLAESYLHILDCVKEIELNRQLLAGWANRAWALDVGKVVASLSDPECLMRLGFIGSRVDVEQDEQDAYLWFQLVVSTASHRCWSMAMNELPPDQWFGILDQDNRASTMAFAKLRHAFDVVEKARAHMSNDELSAVAKEAGNRKCSMVLKPTRRRSESKPHAHTRQAYSQTCALAARVQAHLVLQKTDLSRFMEIPLPLLMSREIDIPFRC